ncbi:MAG: PspC domain-containing protein [Anaerolineae bacterium]|nr:PspC domain-containing protein [Anaerolineae bacterium]
MNSVLYRSQKDRMLGGVCGGLGDYLGIDSTLVRLFFVLLVMGSGVGVLIYLALWIVAPDETQIANGTTWGENFKDSTKDFGGRARAVGEEFGQAVRTPHPKAGTIIGVALIIAGSLLFIDNLSIPWLWWFSFDVLWPGLLVLGGSILIFRRAQGV